MKFIKDKSYGYIPVLKIGPNRYTEPCPFCLTKHLHGLAPGHRSPHCASIETLITEITLSSGFVIKQENGYILKPVTTNQ